MQRASRVSLIAIVIAAAGGVAALVSPVVGCMGAGTTCPPLILTDASLDAHEAGPGVAGVRLANLSPTAPSIDFCIAPVETGVFQGPLLAQYAATLTSQGMTASGSNLAYPQVSAYITVKPDTYTARIVGAGDTDCNGGPLRQDVPLPSLAGGGFATLALLGETAPTPSLQGIALQDDPTQPVGDAGAKLYIRFLHAAPNQGDIQVNLNAKPLFDLAYGQASSSDAGAPDATVKVDKNGYLVTSALSGGKCAVVPAADAAAGSLTTGAINAAAGAVLTVAFVGDTAATDDSGTGAPLQLFECVDNAATTGVFGTCMVLDGGF
jgi:hypothetical protein